MRRGKARCWARSWLRQWRYPPKTCWHGLGVKDSKLLAPKERERLYPLIRKRCRITTVKLDAQDIDASGTR